MNWIEVIQMALSFIEGEIQNSKLSTELIAKHVNVSESHFARAFNVLTGFTLSEYIRNRRLCVAGELLKKSGLPIIDVACEVGYESPEAFSKAFKRFHGVNPKDAKNSKLKEFYPLHIKLILTQERPLTWRIEEKGEIFLSGSTDVVPSDDSSATAYLWSQSESNGYFARCCNFSGFDTLVGVLVDKEYTIKAKCSKGSDETTSVIPPHKWAVFPCEGEMPKSILKVWSQIYESWMQRSGYQIAEVPMLEVYYEVEEGYGCEIWIAIK